MLTTEIKICQMWTDKKEKNTWEIIIMKKQICWTILLTELKSQKMPAIVGKFGSRTSPV